MFNRISLLLLALGVLVAIAALPAGAGTAAEASGSRVGPQALSLPAVGQPNFQITISDDTGGSGSVGTTFNWTLEVDNVDTGIASFAPGQQILTLALPTTGATYDAPFTAGSAAGTAICSIDGSFILTCTATTSLTFNQADTFFVVIPVTPTAGGTTLIAPLASSGCTVDPNNVVAESNESDNNCSPDSVSVAVANPDLIVNKFDNTATGTAGPSQPWLWELLVQNIGNADAVFPIGSVVLIDNLPAGPTYGAASVDSVAHTDKGKAFRADTIRKLDTVQPGTAKPGSKSVVAPSDARKASADSVNVTGTVTCNIAGNVLTCTATTAVTVGVGGNFEVAFSASATSPNSYTNPSGPCSVDPANVVVESQDGNNNCSPDTVTVVLPNLIVSQTDSGGGVATVGTPFNLSVTVTNSGDLLSDPDPTVGQARFAQNDVVLTYQRNPVLVSGAAQIGLTNGLTGTLSCTTSVSALLTCTAASSPVTLDPHGSVTIVLPQTAPANGPYANPPTAAGCNVDPNGVVAERDETDNVCVPAQITVVASGQTAPAITSANNTAFTYGQAGTFTVTTTGAPAPALSETGALPTGVTFIDNANGTATLAGTATSAPGPYPFTITANNGITPPATQSFTLTVTGTATAITSANNASFAVGAPGTFTVLTTGGPAPALSETGALPTGVTFVDNGNGTATLAGTPAAGTAGIYPLTINATNGVNPPATQAFTLTVSAATSAPVITSGNATSFVIGTPGTFTVTATGAPTPAISRTGVLPTGVTFVDNGNGTATLSGTPAAGTAGSYPLTITATNGVNPPATQAFTLTVTAATIAPAITSGNATSFAVGTPGTFMLTATGAPTPAITRTGALPAGVSFVDNGNGTGTLAGTPAAGTAGAYPQVFTATNGVNPPATQNFTLTVTQGAAAPTISKSFVAQAPSGNVPNPNGKGLVPKTFGVGDTAVLSFTLANPNVAQSLTGAGFTDTFPAGLVVATPNGLTGSCGGGTITAVAGSGVVTLTGATLMAGQTCTFSVNTTPTSSGNKVNTTGLVTSNQSGQGGFATATLVVGTANVAKPTFTKTFTSNDVPLNTPVTLKFAITNTDPATTLTGAAFTDVLPAGLVVNTPSASNSNACGAGVVSAASGSGVISFTGGTIAPGQTCVINVQVVAITNGAKLNTTGPLTTNETGSGPNASDTLRAGQLIPSKSIVP